MIKKERLPIVFFALLCLLSGILSGLNRIGWSLPMPLIAAHHGAIMVGGFLGTLIALEKIGPLKKKILYIIPVVNATSVIFFFTGHPKVSIYILIASSVALSFVFLYYLQKQRTIVYLLMLVGSLSWGYRKHLATYQAFLPASLSVVGCV